MTIKNLLECDVLGTVALLEYKGKDKDGKVIEERLWASEELAGLKDVPSEYMTREVAEIRPGYFVNGVSVSAIIFVLVKEA
jgi:hypothetical protein